MNPVKFRDLLWPPLLVDGWTSRQSLDWETFRRYLDPESFNGAIYRPDFLSNAEKFFSRRKKVVEPLGHSDHDTRTVLVDRRTDSINVWKGPIFPLLVFLFLGSFTVCELLNEGVSTVTTKYSPWNVTVFLDFDYDDVIVRRM